MTLLKRIAELLDENPDLTEDEAIAILESEASEGELQSLTSDVELVLTSPPPQATS